MFKKCSRILLVIVISLITLYSFFNILDTKAATQYCCKCATGVSLDKTQDKSGSCKSFSTKDEAELNCKAKNCLEDEICEKGCDTTKWTTDDSAQNEKNSSLSTSELLKNAQLKAAANLNPASFFAPTDIVARAIKFSLALIGIVTLALYLWAGFLWATSQGNAEKTGKAAQILVWTTLGVVVILSSYLLVNYLFTAVIG